MILYVIDTTINPPQEKLFQTYPGVLRYLEGMSKRAYRQTRAERMIMLEELGHGYDDSDSVNFVRSMATAFEMGIIRDEGGRARKTKCDISTLTLHQKEEFGN